MNRKALAAFLLALVILSPSLADAQRKRKRIRNATFPITVAKIRGDITNRRLENIPTGDGRTNGWIFAEDELKEISIVSKSRAGNYTTVVINMKTGNSGGQLLGKLRLFYQLGERYWELTDIENISFRFHNYNFSTDPVFNNPTYKDFPQQNNNPSFNVPQRVPIMASAFTVAAGHFAFQPFEVPPTGGRVVGWFRASGGRNDIRCWIIAAFEFENLRNGNAFRFFYDSNWVTVGNLNHVLTGGSYYIIFDNRPAAFTSKAVNSQIFLEY